MIENIIQYGSYDVFMFNFSNIVLVVLLMSIKNDIFCPKMRWGAVSISFALNVLKLTLIVMPQIFISPETQNLFEISINVLQSICLTWAFLPTLNVGKALKFLVFIFNISIVVVTSILHNVAVNSMVALYISLLLPLTLYLLLKELNSNTDKQASDETIFIKKILRNLFVLCTISALISAIIRLTDSSFFFGQTTMNAQYSSETAVVILKTLCNFAISYQLLHYFQLLIAYNAFQLKNKVFKNCAVTFLVAVVAVLIIGLVWSLSIASMTTLADQRQIVVLNGYLLLLLLAVLFLNNVITNVRNSIANNENNLVTGNLDKQTASEIINRERFLKMSSFTNVAMAITSDTGHVLYANNALAKLAGSSVDEVIGDNFFCHFKSSDKNDIFFKQFVESEMTTIEIDTCFTKMNDNKTWVHATFSKEFDPVLEGHVIYAVFSDITELQEVAQQLVEANDELLMNKKRLQELYDFSSIGIIMLSNSYCTQYTNKAAADIFDSTVEHMNNKYFLETTEISETTMNYFNKLRTEKNKGVVTIQYITHHRNMKGEILWLNLMLNAVYDANSDLDYLYAFFIDISREKHDELELKRLNFELTKNQFEFEALLKIAKVGIITIDTNLLVAYANDHAAEIFNIDKNILVGRTLPPLDSSQKYANALSQFFAYKEAEVFDDIMNFESTFIRGDGTMGWISLCWRRIRDADNQITGYSAFFVDITETKLKTDSLKIEVDKAVAAHKNLQKDIILSISKLSEMHDDVTGQHIDRIRGYSKILAEELQKDERFKNVIDDRFVDNMYVASPLHDIGKLAIGDDILLKPGKLTPQEFEVMKTHTTLGAEALSISGGEEAEYINFGREIAKYHHEKWDGSGYPAGLAGKDIPISARIVAIVDVFDALLAVRPYKSAFTLEQTMDIIRDGKGKHFDPDIAEVFLQNIDKFKGYKCSTNESA